MHQTIDEDGKMGITHPKADVSDGGTISYQKGKFHYETDVLCLSTQKQVFFSSDET
jgi:hypothetical protein